jgi:hypothetical protein
MTLLGLRRVVVLLRGKVPNAQSAAAMLLGSLFKRKVS